MAKRKSKRRRGQVQPNIPRTPAQYRATPERRKDSYQNVTHVVQAMRADGLSLWKAAREHNVSPKTVLRYGSAALRKTLRGTYKAKPSDRLFRELLLPLPSSEHHLTEVLTRDSRMATTASKFSQAAKDFLQTGDDSVRHFSDEFIVDAEGNRISLRTDLDKLERLGAGGVLSFESLYARGS
jgi:hypothetical protein